jgi:hypothetical protein
MLPWDWSARAVIASLFAAAAGCGGGSDTNDSIFGSGGDVDTGADGATAGDASGSDGAGSGTSASDSSAVDESEGTGLKFDTPDGADGGDDGGGNCNCGNDQWSYIWIANSQQGTVSKINTRTLEEEGRYTTRPDGQGDPSRTSVSIDGKAVAVANRDVGIVKIWAREDLCVESNGVAGIQTSTGKADVLPWGDDECVAWFTDFPNMTVQRPVQWTPGEGQCHDDQKIWTTTGTGGAGMSTCGNDGLWVYRLDGETGTVEDTIMIPDAMFPCDQTMTDNGVGLGPYGGAVDADGNFFFHGYGNGKLVRVDFATLQVEIVSGGTYGITVDTHGRVWGSSALWRLDWDSGDYLSANVPGAGGLAQDLQGRMWAASETGVTWVDLETLAVGDTVALPGSGTVKGVSVDIDGFVWAIRQGDSRAFKVDPDTFEITFYDGLDGPYTYSDMTGGAIHNVTCNPEG